MAAGVDGVSGAVLVLQGDFLQDGAVCAFSVPDKEAAAALGAKAGADGDIGILEGEGIGEMGAYGVYYAPSS